MREINVVSRVRISENGKAVLYEKRYHGISGKPSLTFNGTTAHCLAFCSGAKNSDNVDATLTLYQNGRKLTSWSDSGKGSLTIIGDYAAAVSGKEYTLTLTYAIDGTKKPSVSVTAVCP